MKIIVNDIFPFKGFSAMTIWPFCFMRKECYLKWVGEYCLKWVGTPKMDTVMNHEGIHAEQQKEMLPVAMILAALLAALGCGWWSLLALPLYFWWYIAEWFVRLLCQRRAYYNISFEREAYAHESHYDYCEERRPFAWLGWLRKKKA